MIELICGAIWKFVTFLFDMITDFLLSRWLKGLGASTVVIILFLFVKHCLFSLIIGGDPPPEPIPTSPTVIARARISEKLYAFNYLPLEKITVDSVPLDEISDTNAYGSFSRKIKTTEKLYQPVEMSEALSKLGVGDLAKRYRPQDTWRFYEVIIPKGDEVELTVSIDLNKRDNEWQVNPNTFQFNFKPPIEIQKDYVPESKLPVNVYKLDVTKTLDDVLKNFAEKAITEELSKLDMPVEKITDSLVKWTSNLSGDSALGTFSAETKTTKTLYQSVIDVSEALRKLGVDAHYKDYLPQDLQFYEVIIPEGSNMTLEGSVELTKCNNNWEVSSIQYDDCTPPIKGYFLEHELPKDTHKLENLQTCEFIVKSFKDRIRQMQKDDFDKFCKGYIEHEGTLEHNGTTFNVRVVFDRVIGQNPDRPDRVEGKIKIWYRKPGERIDWSHERPFSLSATNLRDGVTPSLTGNINNNALPTLSDFQRQYRPHHTDVFYFSRLHEVLRFYVTINIQLGGGMQISLLHREEPSKTKVLALPVLKPYKLPTVPNPQPVPIPRPVITEAEVAAEAELERKEAKEAEERITAQKREIEGTWRQHIDGREAGDFAVKFYETTGLYEMPQVGSVSRFGYLNTRGISNIRYDGRTWSFDSDWGYKIGKFELKKVDTNTFEGMIEGSRNKWVRIVSVP